MRVRELAFFIVPLWVFTGETPSPFPKSQVVSIEESRKIMSKIEARVLEANENRVMMEIISPDYRINKKMHEGTVFHTIEIPGCVETTIPGSPQLPMKGILLGIPPEVDIRLEAQGYELSEISGYDIYPVPHIKPREDFLMDMSLSQVDDLRYSFVMDKEVYSSESFYPGVFAKLGPIGYIRNQKVVQISVFPVQYSPKRRTIRFYKKIRLTLHFKLNHKGIQRLIPKLRDQPRPFEKLFSHNLLNYESAKGWRVEPKLKRNIKSTLQRSPGWKFFLDKDGIYRLDKPFLDSVGMALEGVDPRRLKIINKGNEIPIYVYGEEDEVFDSQDYIQFYGVAETTYYTSDNVYWLTYDEDLGLRMGVKDGTPYDTSRIPNYFYKRLRFEEDRIYGRSVEEGEGADHWFWDYLVAPANKDFTLNIPYVADTTANCRIKISLQGFSHTSANPDHHAEIYLNNNKIADLWWDGQTKAETEVEMSQSILEEGDNLLRVRGPNDTGSPIDIFYINYFEIEYWHRFKAEMDWIDFSYMGSGNYCFDISGFITPEIELFDITDESNIKRIEGFEIDTIGSYRLRFQDLLSGERKYLALSQGRIREPKRVEMDTASNLKSNRADYLIITYGDFYDDIFPLAQWWRDKGLKTEIIRITDIYDEFNYGIHHPKAVKDFLDYAYHSWISPPTFVLLVGDATFDPKDNMKLGRKDYIPTHLFQSSTYNMETASDHWFACVSGEDRYPDLLIGRINARNRADVSQTVEKILQYEKQLSEMDWHRTALFVADNPDQEGDYETISEELILNHFPSDFNAFKVYLSQCSGPADARNKIISNINNGCALTHYMGHGGIDIWAHENIFHSNDVDSLDNFEKYPMVITMTCLDGYFHHAKDEYCLAEEFLRAKEKGSVLCWAPTGYGYSPPHRILSKTLLDAFFKENNRIVGSAIAEAKIKLLTDQPAQWDHVEMFTLFGDPATEMVFYNRPDLLPVSSSFEPEEVYEGDTLHISSIIENDGRVPASNIIVQYYDDGEAIGEELIIPSLLSGEKKTVDIYWEMNKVGLHSISVMVDPDDEILESSELNNYLSDTVRVKKRDTTGIAEDTKPPNIEVTIDGYKIFNHSRYVSSRPRIEIKIIDDNGVVSNSVSLDLTSGREEIGLNWNTEKRDNTLRLFSQPSSLSDGTYTLHISVADNSGNEASREVSFMVESKLKLSQVLNYPNPCKDHTFFTYLLSQPTQEVKIRIYTISGRLIKEIRNAPGKMNFNSIRWDLKDEDGHRPSNGIYLYKTIASGMNGEKAEIIEKLMILR